LLAVIHTLFEEELVTLGRAKGLVRGLDELRRFASSYSPEAVSPLCRAEPTWIRDLARTLARTARSAVYGRVGICLQQFGLVAAWAINVVNVLTGSLDREGGVMFPRPATGISALRVPRGRPPALGRWTSRVSGHPEVFGELPAVAMAEEMFTPGPGQIRALITHSGNPVLSVPGGDRLVAALEQLDFMVSVDLYINETTQHADVILPSPAPLERSFSPYIPQTLATHSFAKFSPAYLPKSPGQLEDDEILLRLAVIVSPEPTDVSTLRRRILEKTVTSFTVDPTSPVYGRNPGELLARLQGGTDPERLLDLQLRMGPFGDAFETRSGINLAVVAAAPHGLTLGPLVPLLPDVLRTADGLVDLLPEQLEHQAPALEARLNSADDLPLRLIGRRQLQSNNSWMHNVARLVGGRNRCTLQIHPSDAATRRLASGDAAELRSAIGSIVLEAEVTQDVMIGVVCAPHGWGHQTTRMAVASKLAGGNVNAVVPTSLFDTGTGNAAPNGTPVEVVRVPTTLSGQPGAEGSPDGPDSSGSGRGLGQGAKRARESL
jgi:anaerobic selenocysteine-containing dehydrogenase